MYKEIQNIEKNIIDFSPKDIEDFIQYSLRIALPSLVKKV